MSPSKEELYAQILYHKQAINSRQQLIHDQEKILKSAFTDIEACKKEIIHYQIILDGYEAELLVQLTKEIKNIEAKFKEPAKEELVEEKQAVEPEQTIALDREF